MRNALLLSLSFLLLLSCQQPQPPKLILKECTYQTSNPTLQLYNDVLIELVENNFYHLYLGESFVDSVSEIHNLYEPEDSTKTYEKLRKVYALYSQRQRAIFKRPEKWCTLYLDTTWNGKHHFEDMLRYYAKDSTERFFRRHFGFEAPDWKPHYLYTLQTQQTDFTAKDFSTCTFKVADIKDYRRDKNNCEVGRMQFSKVIYNKDQTKAWLYYEFHCDGNCGTGDVLTVEKVKNKWVIKKTAGQWIS
ncbi:hypothetical protein GU926_13835 [Nibribacter ruber]|uniref:Lipoprotein n=1 Tax=Nibribacter ruber TaxID=2698458 RepID=A0A6P1P235_9BACT|nr:hypothetical protein [Nibribacter ruber]QHL88455.1 hypothetical protein GU926_13835 [Nibribacter ruber]